MMDLSTLKPKHGARRPSRRIGRGEGSGRGGTAGKGHKGQKARSGGGIPSWFEGGQMPLVRRLPKLGFKAPFRVGTEIVNLKDLEGFEANANVDVEALQKKGLLPSRIKKPVKILAKGELKISLNVKAHAFSTAAKESIEKAGGKAEVIAFAGRKRSAGQGSKPAKTSKGK